MPRGRIKTRVGVVVSDKMDKTVTVAVERITDHSVYRKPIRKTTKFKAHDEKNECRVGDKVAIVETHPLSKTKGWKVMKVIERAATLAEYIIEEVEEKPLEEIEGVKEQ